MTRQLPWKNQGNVKTEAASSPLRTPKTENSGFPVASPRTTPRTAPQARRGAGHSHFPLDSSDPIRSPSTSPPPEPPQEQLMIPGDDRYRMVEDELLQIAQRFTTHLHRAEYNRLKKQARTRNAAAIREIERPVVPGSTPTTAARLSRARSKQLAKQRSAVPDGEPPSTGLGSMLDAPRAEQRVLPRQTSSLAASASRTTRAAAGFSSNRLGAQSVARRDVGSGSRVQPSPRQQQQQPPPARRAADMSPGVGPSSAAIRSRQTPAMGMEMDVETEDEDDGDDPFGVTKRRINRQKSREQLKRVEQRPPPAKKPSPDTMPFFI